MRGTRNSRFTFGAFIFSHILRRLTRTGSEVVIDLRHSVDPQLFPDALSDTLARILKIICNNALHLQKATLHIQQERTPAFEAAFSRHAVAFSTIRDLAVGPSNEFIIKACPQLVSLSAHKSDDPWDEGGREYTLNILNEAAGLVHLETFLLHTRYESIIMDGKCELHIYAAPLAAHL